MRLDHFARSAGAQQKHAHQGEHQDLLHFSFSFGF
jgi:hypothetical protein